MRWHTTIFFLTGFCDVGLCPKHLLPQNHVDFGQGFQSPLDCRVALLVGEGAVVGPKHQAVGHAFFAFDQLLATGDVK